MEDEGFQDGSRHIPEASTSSLDLRPRPEHDLVHALVNANHSHLVERGGAKELLQRRDNEPTAWPEQWMAILAEPDASRRRDLAYLVRLSLYALQARVLRKAQLMLSLPTPALSDLQARVRPLVKLDLLTLLPEEVSRHILAQLEVKAVLNASVCLLSSFLQDSR